MAKKNLLSIIIIAALSIAVCVLAILLILSSNPEISVSDDGFLTVNGEKTQYKVENAGHVHSFGDWKLHNSGEADCEKKLFYRTCPACSGIEWREGEHSYSEELCFDESFHWQECSDCGKTTEKKDHTESGDGICTVCSASLGDTKGIIYALSEDKSYAIVAGYDGDALNIKIADSYNGVPVKVIGEEAFRSKKITSVTMPDTITDIEEDAFIYCSSLKSVKLSSSLLHIGATAFAQCGKLEDIDIPNSVVSIGNSAFLYCKSSRITEYSFGKYIAIGDNPYGALIELTNKNFTEYEIHKDTKIIAASTFANCSRLSSITIPGSVSVIGRFAFDFSNELKSVTIEKGVSVIEMYAFNAHNIENVYYTGSEDEWSQINIDNFESGNDDLLNATIHYNHTIQK